MPLDQTNARIIKPTPLLFNLRQLTPHSFYLLSYNQDSSVLGRSLQFNMNDNVCYESIDLIPQSPQLEYSYQPIKPGWIRILDLLNTPGDDKPLQCRLRQVRLPEAKVRNSEHGFNALSYVWGSDRKRFEMQVLSGNQSKSTTTTTTSNIPLTKSLHEALQDLRDCEDIQPKTFWIDQICINQSNDEEKTQQVAQMGKVFQYATSVWTYLGPRKETDDEALDLMTEICDHFEPLTKTPKLALLLDKDELFQYENFSKFSRMNSEDVASDLFFPNDLFQGEGLIVFHNLSQIVDGPWTHRLWLFQENILNDDLNFFRGHGMVRPEDVELLCSLSWAGLVPYIPRVYENMNIWERRRAQHGQDKDKYQRQLSSLSLYALLRDTKQLRCHDPRDRIYSILGIAVDAKKLNTHPDYSISAAQAFTNLSVAFMKDSIEEDDPYLLRQLEYTYFDAPGGELYSRVPTWVPTYLDYGDQLPWQTNFNVFQTLQRGTGRNWADVVSFESSPAVKNGILVVKGYRLELSLDRNIGPFPDVDFTAHMDMMELDHALTFLKNLDENANGSIRLQSRFWEACVLDRRILDFTIDSADGEAAAAQALSDVIELLKKAKSGDRISNKNWKDEFYLPIENLPGGLNGSAYLLFQGINRLAGRSLWLTDEQHICVAPNTLQKDDIAVALLGGRYFYYLRPLGDKLEYIGFGWISGCLNGEPFVDGWEDKVETFKLI